MTTDAVQRMLQKPSFPRRSVAGPNEWLLRWAFIALPAASRPFASDR